MREKAIEQQLVRAAKAASGIALKLVCPGFDGVPDRLVLMPCGRLCFVEVKRPGAKPRPLQVARHQMLRRLGFLVFVLDDPTQIDGVIKEVLAWRK